MLEESSSPFKQARALLISLCVIKAMITFRKRCFIFLPVLVLACFFLVSHLYFQVYCSSQQGPSPTAAYEKERGKVWNLWSKGSSGCTMASGLGESLVIRRNCGRSRLPRRSVWGSLCCARGHSVNSWIKWPLPSGKGGTGTLMTPTRSTMTAQIFVYRNLGFAHL